MLKFGVVKVSKKFERMAIAYRYFAREFSDYDYSEQAKTEMFAWETYGRKRFDELLGKTELSPKNGYALGKHLIDITVSNWNEDMPELLKPFELYMMFPKWFAETVLQPQRHLPDEKIEELEKDIGYLYLKVEFENPINELAYYKELFK